MYKTLTLAFLICLGINFCAKSYEYGLRMRAGIEESYDGCGSYHKDLVLGLGLGRYRTAGDNYYSRIMPYSPAYRAYTPMFIPSTYGQSLYSSLGLYEHPSYYSPHSNMYDGSPRYNPYGLNYRPVWY